MSKKAVYNPHYRLMEKIKTFFQIHNLILNVVLMQLLNNKK